ncbi:type IVB secretion system protein IcmH/DotU [Pseudomonas corrugata]|uniref:type IVB secretion system protein IcmH/DotU n=1 Tax=Pseudomonas corrugata TaxID=47879 RepID=UPI001586E6D0|nr:type IVB secretion system protein IcmH/DotU [Pseudomonas corrugata]MCI0993431.1 DotU family type IV/VI secretion system protein [Pseudomonas corrugata]NUT65312.1 DotU family type IV/VI secretion system protein [Pseudomonas corrugata]
MDKENPQDETTVLLDHHGQRPASQPLTDAAAPPRIEQLQERMIYAAHQPSTRTSIAGLNPLVAAASGLLSQLVRLKHGRNREELRTLKRELTRDLEQFEARAAQSGVESSQLVAARYVLCTVLDEAVVTTAWGHGSSWSQMSLLSTFHNETFGGEKVFQLLDRLSKNPTRHLPMLELLYVCLSLGFEGKYRVQARGALELEGIRDDLYRQIRQIRGEVPSELSPHCDGLEGARHRPVRLVPVWTVALVTVVCLGMMYSSFAWVLAEHRKHVLHPYQSLEPVTAQPLP